MPEMPFSSSMATIGRVVCSKSAKTASLATPWVEVTVAALEAGVEPSEVAMVDVAASVEVAAASVATVVAAVDSAEAVEVALMEVLPQRRLTPSLTTLHLELRDARPSMSAT